MFKRCKSNRCIVSENICIYVVIQGSAVILIVIIKKEMNILYRKDVNMIIVTNIIMKKYVV